MQKLLASLGAVALMASFSSGAQAVIITAGPFSPGGGDITFDSNLAPGTVINTPVFSTAVGNQAGTQSFGGIGVSFSGTGFIVNNPVGTSQGQAATPANDLTNYMAVLAGGTETLSFSSTSSNFGLYWGSIDDFNVITFKHTGFADVVFHGNDPVFAANPLGNQVDGNTNKYVTFNGISFDSIVLQSTTANAFEFDNVTFTAGGGAGPAAPEASTWAMMILGFLGVGFISYRRKSAKSSLRFA